MEWVMIAALAVDVLIFRYLLAFRGEVLDWIKAVWRKALACFRQIVGGNDG